MDSELNDKIKEIGGMFGITEMPDNIGDIVTSFLSSNSSSESEAQPDTKSECQEEPQQESHSGGNNGNIGITNLLSGMGGGSDIFEDIDITKVLKLLNKYKEAKKNNAKDKKIQLLHAVEPFLNDKRKEKVSGCVKFLTFAEIAKDLKDI